MAVVIALDAGTTGVRAFAVDPAGRAVGYRYREFTQHFPQPGWVEHDATEIWNAIVGTTAELISSLQEPVAAIGITDQRETIVAWDRRTGRPRHRAIVWQDRRTAARCDQLAADGTLPLVREATGLVLDPYFSASKLEWLLTSGGVTADEHLAVGTIDSWLLWNLTGGAVHATEPSNASRTMLFDLRTLDWSDELCELFGVPRHILPEVRPSSGRFGVTHASSGLPPGIPISGIAGDQQAALFGQACLAPGQAKNTYGTGCFMLMNTGEKPFPSTCGLLTTLGYKLGPKPAVYALEGSIAIAGALVQWLRDNLGLVKHASEIEALAQGVDDNGDVYFVPAFSGLYAPHWKESARGVIAGLTRYANKGHIARAALEATAFQTREVLDAMVADSGVAISELRVDGGMVVNELLMQFQADMLNAPVVRPKVIETTALGAAYAAGLAVGYWTSTDDIVANWRGDKTWRPAMDAARREHLFSSWNKAVSRSFDWVA